jgi:hypothetical protein
LRISLEMLREVERALKLVHDEFDKAEDLTDEWRGVVGHDGLGDQLDDFSGNWDGTRENMLESIKSMGELAGQIAQAFEDTDSELERCLTEEGA